MTPTEQWLLVFLIAGLIFLAGVGIDALRTRYYDRAERQWRDR